MKKNMIKQVNETKIKQNSSVQAESTDNFSDKDSSDHNPNNRPMEIEESLDFKMYQMASLSREDCGVSIKCSEEDTPRRNLPVPEPSNTNELWKDCRNKIIGKKREEINKQKSISSLKSQIKKDAILVRQEFSEDELFDGGQKISYVNNQNLNIELKYPFRKEDTTLSKFSEFQALSCRNNFSSKVHIGHATTRSQNNLNFEPSKSNDQITLSNKSIPSSLVQNHTKNSKSFSRLRQPTNVHRNNRKSLDCIKTNLMSRHYKTMKDNIPKISPTSHIKQHFVIQRLAISPRINNDQKTPTRSLKKDLGMSSHTRNRLRM